MLLRRQIERLKLAGSMVLLTLLIGCARGPLVVYPIRDTDFRVTEDEVIMSKWYFENVLKVKLEEGR